MSHETRKKIIEAARDIYAEEGPQGLSMRKVARQVGVSAPAIYRHFEDKEELVTEVCREGFSVFAGYLMRGTGEPGPMERLEATGRGYLEFALDHPQYYEVMFMARHPTFERLAVEAQKASSPTFQILIDRIAECQRAGLMPEGDASMFATAIWSHVHGLVSLWLGGHVGLLGDADALREYYPTYLKQMMHGIT